MVDFEVRCYHKDSNNKVIGAEVIVTDNNNNIKSIFLVDETKFDELSGKLNNLDTTYVDLNELITYLKNSQENTDINATSLNGFASDKFLKKDDVNAYQFTPSAHASTSSTYGAASKTEYGHVKLIDDCTRETCMAGEALSAHQGKVLKDYIDEVTEEMADIRDPDTDKKAHSKFILNKYGKVVTLTIEPWPYNRGEFDDTYRDIPNGTVVLTVPEGWEPKQMIYVANVLPNDVRVRVKGKTSQEGVGHIQACCTNQNNKMFCGSASWIID